MLDVGVLKTIVESVIGDLPTKDELASQPSQAFANNIKLHRLPKGMQVYQSAFQKRMANGVSQCDWL